MKLPLPELTFEEFTALPFQYTMGMRFSAHAQRLYRNEDHGLQYETHTPYNERNGKWGKQENGHFMDGDEREFATVSDLYMAYMHHVCGVAEDSNA